MQRVTTNDITSGRATLPFTSRSAWLNIQAVPRYATYSCAPQARDETVEENLQFQGRETLSECCIHRPRWYVSCTLARGESASSSREWSLNGLVTALHIQLEHLSAHQLKQAMRRYLFALDLEAQATPLAIPVRKTRQ